MWSEQDTISFPGWQAALDASTLAPPERETYRREILTFLHLCRKQRCPASVALARRHLSERERLGAVAARAALRWFFQSAPQREARAGGVVETDEAGAALGGVRPKRAGVPPPAAADTGGADWERDLIRALRTAGLLWRTEETYRGWARRFARFLAPRSPYAATADDLAAFLTRLAVEQRSSPSAQKQALNALVFLLEEALHRHVGQMDFQRARARQRLPTVLAREECRRLFEGLEGTPRLMAELAYGSGLRLMELLRLRVHHLDLERGQLKVCGGKGDKDRMTMLPVTLRPALERQLRRIRTLFDADRAAGLAGVWLPEGLARKYPRAGEQWEWQWLFVASAPRGHPPAATPALRSGASP